MRPTKGEISVTFASAHATAVTNTQWHLRKLEQAATAHKAAIRVMFEERYTQQELSMLAELLGRLPGAGVKI